MCNGPSFTSSISNIYLSLGFSLACLAHISHRRLDIKNVKHLFSVWSGRSVAGNTWTIDESLDLTLNTEKLSKYKIELWN